MQAANLQQRLIIDRHDSALGNWLLAVLLPSPALAPYIREIWYIEGDSAVTRESILPQGDAVLMFSFGTRHGVVDDTGQVETFEHAWFSGIQQGPLLVDSPAGSHLMGVRLTAPGAWRLLSVPMTETQGQVVDLQAMMGAACEAFRQRLGNLPGFLPRLVWFEHWLQHRLLTGPTVHPAVAFAAGAIERAQGGLRLDRLVKETGFSVRWLNHQFGLQVGLNLKRYARLAKFRRALGLLSGAEKPTLTSVALDCGYYDQSHFNREFQAFAGCSPSHYLANKGPDGLSVLQE